MMTLTSLFVLSTYSYSTEPNSYTKDVSSLLLPRYSYNILQSPHSASCFASLLPIQTGRTNNLLGHIISFRLLVACLFVVCTSATQPVSLSTIAYIFVGCISMGFIPYLLASSSCLLFCFQCSQFCVAFLPLIAHPAGQQYRSS